MHLPLALLAAATPFLPPSEALASHARVVLAREHHAAGRLAEARALIEDEVSRRAQDGGAWLLLADCLYRLGEPRAAIRPYETAVRLGAVDAANGWFSIACCHAQLGEPLEAVASLERSLAAGYRWRESLADDRRLASLRTEPDFRALVAPFDPAGLERDEGFRGDLAHLVAEVRRVHWRVRREGPPPAFEEAVASLEAAVPNLSDERVVAGFQRVLATLGDGHSVLYPFGMRHGTFMRVPLDLYLFEEGLFVQRAGPGLEHLVGSRVVAFGDVPWREALDAVAPFVSRDNEQGLAWLGPVYLTFPVYHAAAGLAEASDGLRLEIEDGAATRSVEVQAAPVDPGAVAQGLVPLSGAGAPPVPRYLARSGEVFWDEDLRDGAVVYVQLNRVLDGPGETLDGLAVRLDRRFQEDEVRAVVLDLRHNPGGEGSLVRELVRVLTRFEEDRGGRVVVLVGRNTFSAAQTLVGLLDHWTDAVFVGEPTGSRPTRVGDEAPFRLPFSGARGALASGFHQGASRPEAVWVAPDVFVPPTARDYFAGRDPALEAALEVATAP